MVVLWIVVGVLVLALVGLYAAYNKVYAPPKKTESEMFVPDMLKRHPYHNEVVERMEELNRLPCEFVTTRSYEGLKLSARYYEGMDDKPLCICFHGYRGSAIRDFAGAGLFLIHEGYNVLMVDERGHWRSQGHTITYGIRERLDVLSWVRYANRRFGKRIPIHLFGISMGGGTVLMASGQKLPDNVRGIVADCPFNSPKDEICHVCRKIKLNPTLVWPIIWLSGLIYGRFNISATTAEREVKKTKVPIVIIHGEGDDFVPMYMSEQVRDANPSMITYHSFLDAGHGLSYFYNSVRYEEILRDYFKNVRRYNHRKRLQVTDHSVKDTRLQETAHTVKDTRHSDVTAQ